MRASLFFVILLALVSVVHPAAMGQTSPETSPVVPGLPAQFRGTELESALKSEAWSRAEALLLAAIEKEPRSPALLRLLGGVFMAERKPLNAAIAIKKAEAIEPLDNHARFSLVLAYISLGKGEWARPDLERLIASEPSNNIYEYWLGRVDYDAGQYANAVRHFEQVVRRDPGFVRAHDNLGLCAEALNQPDQALAHYRKAVELNRAAAMKSPWPPLNMAILLRSRGEPDAAGELLREAIGYDESLPQAHFQMGVLLEHEGKLDEAVRELVRAGELDPQYAEPHYALGRVYRRLGRQEEARQALAVFRQLRDAKRKETPK
jgi:tetratricopeptide (TPR) repeat protein